MQKLLPNATQREVKKIKNLKLDKMQARVGSYLHNLPLQSKTRFNRIVSTIARARGIALNTHPDAMLIIHQIAMDTIEIEDLSCALLGEENGSYGSDERKWLLLAKRERREALKDLGLILGKTEKEEAVDVFSGLRNNLREKQKLPAVQTDTNPTGHQRRNYDSVVRTKGK